MSDAPLPFDTRKDQILSDLHAHLRARTRRRRAIRAATSGAGVLALAAAVYFSLPTAPAVPPAPSGTTITQSDPVPVLPEAVAAVAPLTNDSTPVAAASSRVTIRIAGSEPLPTTPCDADTDATVCILSDDQLLAALAEAGQPSGLVRTGGEAFIVPIGSSQPLR